MIAKMQCSNCGAEMSNLNMNWGKKQFLLIIPIMLIGFLPLVIMSSPKGDPTKVLVVSEVTTRTSGKSFEILGLITNSSGRKWTGIRVEAEFYDSSGVFIDEASEYLRSDISGDATEHFKITIPSPPKEVSEGGIKPIVKVSSARTGLF